MLIASSLILSRSDRKRFWLRIYDISFLAIAATTWKRRATRPVATSGVGGGGVAPVPGAGVCQLRPQQFGDR